MCTPLRQCRRKSAAEAGKTTAYGINPDMAVAIDVCHGITPDNSDNAFEVGTGTVLSVGPNLHPKLTDELFAVSKRHGIKVSTDVDGGNTGTDAWEIQVACDGVPDGTYINTA